MSLRKTAITGLSWTFGQQLGNQLIGFVVSILLARMLLPSEFGLIGMVAVFISLGNILSDSGLTQSLIRSENLDQEDFSTVFYFNLGTSILIYFLLFFASPYISAFYGREILTEIIKVYSVVFIINALGSVQNSFLIKKMNFKTQTWIAIPSTLAGGFAGMGMAYFGYGVWSLVYMSLISSAATSIQLWFYSNWKPSLIFNFRKFQLHFKFGYKLALSNVGSKLVENIYLILIGKYFSVAQVGYYHRAEITKQYPVNSLSGAMNKVTFPLFAKIKNDNIRLKKVYKQLMQNVLFIIAPLLIFMAVLAEPLFVMLFTEKWLPAVPYFQILCAGGILYPLHAYNLNIIKVKGKSDLYLKISILKSILILVSVLIGIQYGIYGLLYSQVILSFFVFFINSKYSGKFINYPAWEQVKDVMPILILSLGCGACIRFLDILVFQQNFPNFFRVVIGMGIGGMLYVGMSYIFKIRSFFDLKEIGLKLFYGKQG